MNEQLHSFIRKLFKTHLLPKEKDLQVAKTEINKDTINRALHHVGLHYRLLGKPLWSLIIISGSLFHFGMKCLTRQKLKYLVETVWDMSGKKKYTLYYSQIIISAVKNTSESLNIFFYKWAGFFNMIMIWNTLQWKQEND